VAGLRCIEVADTTANLFTGAADVVQAQDGSALSGGRAAGAALRQRRGAADIRPAAGAPPATVRWQNARRARRSERVS